MTIRCDCRDCATTREIADAGWWATCGAVLGLLVAAATFLINSFAAPSNVGCAIPPRAPAPYADARAVSPECPPIEAAGTFAASR